MNGLTGPWCLPHTMIVRVYDRDLVLQCMDYLVSADSTSLDGKSRSPIILMRKMWSRLIAAFHPSTGPIALPVEEDDRLEMEAGSFPFAQQSFSQTDLPPELTENVIHWSRLSSEWDTNKALWITTDNKEQCSAIAQTAFHLLSPSGGDETRIGVALVDLSKTRSSFWPLTKGLALASPEYRADLVQYLPAVMDFRLKKGRALVFGRGQADISPWLYYKDKEVRLPLPP
jgi:hypothetical protein